jgi:hypothetical protein
MQTTDCAHIAMTDVGEGGGRAPPSVRVLSINLPAQRITQTGIN